ncbi:hypothetical protein [Streptomyces sp. NPDC059828]|uniref:hypothetical protein n=1 Tax=Streptomyces sp. NPDC059828 TaxID=3346965 RepID=UPI00366A395F
MTQNEHPHGDLEPHDFAAVYAERDLGEVNLPFVQRASPDGRGYLVQGCCPRCHGETTTEYRRGIPGAGTKGPLSRLNGRQATQSSAVAAGADLVGGEVHFCECGHAHPSMPAHAVFVGCGASWRIRTGAGNTDGGSAS